MDTKRTDRDMKIKLELEMLVSNRDELADFAFHRLIEYGIDLSDCLLYLLMIQIRSADIEILSHLDEVQSEIISDAVALFSTQFQVYSFFYSGTNVLLMTQQKTPRHSAVSQNNDFILRMSQHLISKYQQHQLQILQSRETDRYGVLTYSCGALYHAAEFSYFLTDPPAFAVIDFEAQHTSYQLSAFRKLALNLTQRLLAGQIAPQQSASEICNLVLAETKFSPNILHRRMDLFAVCFMECLISNNVVDQMYLDAENIFNELMMGNNQDNYTANLERILCKLDMRHRYISYSISSERMTQVRQYITQNISDVNLSVNKIAEHFAINRGTLTEEFKRYFGVYLSTFIVQERLEYAQQLISLYPNLAVQKVAEKAGYSDISTMYRSFKRSGLPTPNAMRKTAQKQGGSFAE